LGFVENAEQFPVEVTVTSQYRVAGVTVDGPPINQLADGSFNRHADLTFEGLNIDATQTQWTFPLPVINPGTWDGGMTFTATDEVFRADAGDAAAHQATLTASVQLILPPTTGALQPTISVSSGATALPANSFIPLDAAPITLTATWPALPAGVAQAAFISSQGGVTELGLAPVTGSSASLTLDPTLIGMSNITVQACPADALGFQSNASFCSTAFQLIIGELPAPNALETRELDGGHALWFMGADAGPGTFLVSALADVPNPGGLPATAASDAGYFIDSLAPTENTNSVFAVRADGTGLDRFDCGGGCRTPDFIAKSASGAGLRQVFGASAAAVAVTDVSGFGWFAPIATGGAAVAADPGGANVTFEGPMFPVGGGLLTEVTSNAESTTPFEVVFYHPKLTKPVKIGGDMTATINITAFPSGEFAVQYSIGGTPAAGTTNNFLVVGYFNGTTLAQTAPAPINLINGQPDFAPAQPGVLIGTVDADPAHAGVQPFVANATTGSIKFPVPVSCPTVLVAGNSCTGATRTTAVQTRLGVPPPTATIGVSNPIQVMEGAWQGGNFSISDDQQKALIVSQDQQKGSEIYSLWIIDIASGGALQLYTTPLLAGVGTTTSNAINGIDALAPHFVHSAAAAVNTIPGKAPSGTLAAVPVAVWAELLEPDVNDPAPTNMPPVQTALARIFYSTYASGLSTGAPVLVDKLAFYDLLRPDFYFTSAAAGAIYFPGVTAVGGELNLYSAPLTGTTSTASLVMDQFTNYRLREDTQRIIVSRADGTVWAGVLAASTAQRAALSPVLSGAFGGLPGASLPNGDSSDYVATIDFTPDGDHAWAFVQVGDDPFDNPTSALLEVVDLRSGARTNYGQVIFSLQGGIAPVGFLGASVAISQDQRSFETNGSGSNLYAAAASNGTKHQGYNSSFIFQFASSVDGTEGYVFNENGFQSDIVKGIKPAFTTGQVQANFFASADPSLYQGNFLLPTGVVSVIAGQQATFSPYGMPYADAWDIFSVFRPPAVPTPLTTVFFKSFGGGARPPVPIATFVPNGPNTRQTADNTELLIDFTQGDGSQSAFARRVKLSGLPVPVRPLP